MGGQSALWLATQLVKDKRKGVAQLQLSLVGKDQCDQNGSTVMGQTHVETLVTMQLTM